MNDFYLGESGEKKSQPMVDFNLQKKKGSKNRGKRKPNAHRTKNDQQDNKPKKQHRPRRKPARNSGNEAPANKN